MPLTQEQVDSGNYGSIIPLDSNVVPPGGGVYQLDSSYYRDDKGDYIGTHPGFMKPDKHPDGKCVPCCYKSCPRQTRKNERKMRLEIESLHQEQNQLKVKMNLHKLKRKNSK